MKKTLTVNLNNTVFHIDDDAYEMLQSYLHEISQHFTAEDERQEIMNDIEARIAELFSEKLLKNKNVVNVADVQEVIDVMGKPSQYAEDGQDADTPKSESEHKPHKSRRFYRDPENAILGGVAAGLAAFLKMDVTLVRIILVVLAFITGSGVIPVYLITWLIAPQALSASQRLEMQGEAVTVDSIKTELNNAKAYVESDKFKQSATSVGVRMGEIVRLLLKVSLGFIGAVLGIAGVVVVGSLLVVLFVLIFNPALVNGYAPSEFIAVNGVISPERIIMLTIALLLLVGCPIFTIVYWAVQVVAGRRKLSKTASWVLFILWLAGLFMFLSVGTETLSKIKSNQGFHAIYWSGKEMPEAKETRTVPAFTSLVISGNIQVILEKDSVGKLVLEAENDVLPLIKTEVSDGVLRISSNNLIVNKTVIVHVPVDSLLSITCTGATQLDASDNVFAKKFILTLSGASQANFHQLQAADLELNLSGASQIEMQGNAENVRIVSKGASQIEADYLVAKNVYVQLSGLCNAELNATDKLDARVTGASHIECSGNPSVVLKQTRGGGTIEVD